MVARVILRGRLLAEHRAASLACIALPGCSLALPALVDDHLVDLLSLLHLDLLVHVVFTLDVALDLGEARLSGALQSCSVRIDRPFAGRVRFVFLGDDRSVRSLHSLNMDRLADSVFALVPPPFCSLLLT